MLKYPECCYRQGNTFGFSEKLPLAFGAWNSFNKRYVMFEADGTYAGDEVYLTKKALHDLPYISMSAETLAELARDNGDGFVWDDVKNVVFLCPGQKIGWENIYQNKDEPLGSFFLRVAKLRKYIK